MKKRVGCLHVHYSNIEYIEKALSPYDFELVHFVDPGLMYHVASDSHFQESKAQQKVKEQLEWIAGCHVDAILITCTNYIALLQEEPVSAALPIIKIDEPYFEHICKIEEPQTIFFTNPATVKGTMDRLNRFADRHQKMLNVEVVVIEDSFELMMQGRKKEYDQKISSFLQNHLKTNKKLCSVAQLSMADAAQQAQQASGIDIINPLDTLVSSIINTLDSKNNI